jgi:hypothetical protein
VDEVVELGADRRGEGRQCRVQLRERAGAQLGEGGEDLPVPAGQGLVGQQPFEIRFDPAVDFLDPVTQRPHHPLQCMSNCM